MCACVCVHVCVWRMRACKLKRPVQPRHMFNSWRQGRNAHLEELEAQVLAVVGGCEEALLHNYSPE